MVSEPNNGTLSGTAPNLTYSPLANFNGNDSFTYKANDGEADSNTATVAISVKTVNDLPVVFSQSANVDEDGSVSITLKGSDEDEDNCGEEVKKERERNEARPWKKALLASACQISSEVKSSSRSLEEGVDGRKVEEKRTQTGRKEELIARLKARLHATELKPG